MIHPFSIGSYGLTVSVYAKNNLTKPDEPCSTSVIHKKKILVLLAFISHKKKNLNFEAVTSRLNKTCGEQGLLFCSYI